MEFFVKTGVKGKKNSGFVLRKPEQLYNIFMLNYPVASYNTQNNRNNRYYQKNVNYVAHSKTCKSKVADKPQNHKNHCNCIKKISHCIDNLG